MVRAQNFAGRFKSKAHQLNGNTFCGPVSFSAIDHRGKSQTVSTRNNSGPEALVRVHDKIEVVSVPGQSGSLNWHDCAQSLAFDELDARERLIETQSAGTCEWLLDSPDYLRWVDEHGLLLIRGKPGCGKSTLLKFVLSQQTKSVAPPGSLVLSFFFYASGTDLQSSTSGFFRSLLLQLLEKDEPSKSAFMEICRKFCRFEGSGKPRLKWNQFELEGYFQNLVLDCASRRKILIFVDALDECNDKDRDRLISSFHTLCQMNEGPNRPGIFVTCRPYPDGQIRADFQIRLEEESQNDIRTFIEQNLRLPDETPADADELKSTLLSKAKGLFLWLVLIIPQIHDMSGKGLSLRKIQSEILESSRELDSLYEGLLRKIENDELREASILFQWICFATRPLSLDELRIAMTVHLNGSKKSLREYEDAENYGSIPNEAKMKKRMIHLSRGLVDTTTNTNCNEGKAVVSFYHDTIRDFMLRKGLKYLDGRLRDPRSLAKGANVQLANKCLLYLSTDEIRIAFLKKDASPKREFHFLDYAARYWLSHAVTAERESLGEEILWPTETILDVWVKASRDLEHSLSKSATEGTSLMHIAAEYGLQELAKRIMCTRGQRRSTSLRHAQPSMRSAFQLGVKKPISMAAGKHESAMIGKIPLSHRQGQPKTKRGGGLRTMSTKMCGDGKGQVVSPGTVNSSITKDQGGLNMGYKQMEETGYAELVNAQNNNGDSPLHLAAEHGCIGMVAFLCRSGSKTGEPNHDHCTPLHKASQNGHLKVVEFLYMHGADADLHRTTKHDTTPFFAACNSGHIEVVKFLYEHGVDCDLHRTMKHGWTPFSAASNSGHLDVVKFLYEHGVNLHVPIGNGWTPFALASYSGHLDVVRFLYEHVADADLHIPTEYGWTPFSAACESGHLDVVRFLYNQGAVSDIHATIKDDRTLLSVASCSGHLDVVKFLYEHGADVDLHIPDKNGWTPFSAASCSGHLDVVKFLYEHGADVDLHIPKKGGWTPFALASYSGHLDVVRFLYEHGADADLHIPTEYGWTPFSAACESGHLDVVKYLYDQGAVSDIHTTTKDDRTPLSAASNAGHLDVVKFLYEHGADVDLHIPDKNGWIPFSAASDSGHLDVVRFLYEHGADVDLHIPNKNGWTPFLAASDSGHLDVVRFLYEHGADVDLHIPNKNGWIPFSAASDSGHLDVVRFLYEHGADVDLHIPTEYGWTPFSAACESGHLDVVRFLYEHGADADLHIPTEYGWTPFSAACGSGHLDVVRFLYEHGADADLHIPTEYGWTPFSAACESGHLEVVEFLCDHEASVEAQDICGRTSLFLASARGHMEVVQHLLSRGAMVDTNDRYGSTPLFAAVRNGHEKAFIFLRDLQGAYIRFEDGFGHTLLWWARKTGNTTLTEAVIQIAQVRGMQVSETDMAVEASSMSIGGSTQWCDICTRFFPDGSAYHQCSICQGSAFDICTECFEMGARCLDGSHELAFHEPTVL
ncbi:uncharacterized protein N7484_011734 [Penicillium longicatenatum]|uniref:uncharacterized protein n=1 Tax=Penicillium longicatenatum TaxID=1561947 RepID=UPI002546E027|nr:uncharacterized protein N7484_011734 [Penicillium longicatenatum]KAJ5631634.1 hypothetical protein N7484_011734 [Penicillium longicatenatum]